MKRWHLPLVLGVLLLLLSGLLASSPLAIRSTAVPAGGLHSTSVPTGTTQPTAGGTNTVIPSDTACSLPGIYRNPEDGIIILIQTEPVDNQVYSIALGYEFREQTMQLVIGTMAEQTFTLAGLLHLTDAPGEGQIVILQTELDTELAFIVRVGQCNGEFRYDTGFAVQTLEVTATPSPVATRKP